MKADSYAAQRLTRLSAKARKAVELASVPDDENDPPVVGAAKKVAVAGALGAGAYGVGSYLRGRAMGASRDYGPATTLKDHFDLLKLGHQANVGSVDRLRKTAGAAIAGKANVAGTAAKSAAAATKGAVTSTIAKARALLPGEA